MALIDQRTLPALINRQQFPRNTKWKVINIACRFLYKLGMRSNLIIDMAQTEGCTPLHNAARLGNADVAQWLLQNGAMPSLDAKNAMGQTPLDFAHMFGPHKQVEKLLAGAMLANLGKIGMCRPRPSTVPTTVRETAVPMQFPMMLIHVSDFVQLDVLRPHQVLKAQGKLVEWSAEMQVIFFLSHQWTSFSHPDHATVQLRTMQKLFIRMLRGDLPKTSPSYSEAVRLPPNISISSRDWKALVPHAYVWIDFISVRARWPILWFLPF